MKKRTKTYTREMKNLIHQMKERITRISKIRQRIRECQSPEENKLQLTKNDKR